MNEEKENKKWKGKGDEGGEKRKEEEEEVVRDVNRFSLPPSPPPRSLHPPHQIYKMRITRHCTSLV